MVKINHSSDTTFEQCSVDTSTSEVISENSEEYPSVECARVTPTE